MKPLPYGSCVVWSVPAKEEGTIKKIYNILQRFFTSGDETHVSMVMSEYVLPGTYYEFEQSVTARINIFPGTTNPNCIVYDVLLDENVKAAAIEALRSKTFGQVYGFAQTFIFVVRWFLEKTRLDGKFGINAKKLKNPFPFGLICSEAMYLYLQFLANYCYWDDLMEYLHQWSKDCFHAGDAHKVIQYMVTKGYARKI